MLTWPELSRKPALKTRTSTVDPTLRDPMQNGAEATSLQWPRGRRQWDVTIKLLTFEDVRSLDAFVQGKAQYGSQPFFFPDNRDQANPVNLRVRFATLPVYTDSEQSDEGLRQDCTFTLREI